jgi:hypothetical protein
MPSSQIQQDPPITSPIPTSTQHITQLDINPAHTSHECLHSGSNDQFTHSAGADFRVAQQMNGTCSVLTKKCYSISIDIEAVNLSTGGALPPHQLFTPNEGMQGDV